MVKMACMIHIQTRNHKTIKRNVVLFYVLRLAPFFHQNKIMSNLLLELREAVGIIYHCIDSFNPLVITETIWFEIL